MKKDISIIIIIIICLIILFLIYKKIKNKETENKINKETENKINKETENKETWNEETENKVIQPIPKDYNYYLNLIQKVLNDYQNYCKKKNWKFNFINSENTVKNILTHFIVETGNFKYLHSNNFGNITVGSWNSKGAEKCSPYIKELYNHNYIGTEIRSDRGEPTDKQEFRRYEYPEDGIIDYLDLINRGTRYKGIAPLYNRPTPEFIRELGIAGYYSTDPTKIYETAKKIRATL